MGMLLSEARKTRRRRRRNTSVHKDGTGSKLQIRSHLGRHFPLKTAYITPKPKKVQTPNHSLTKIAILHSPSILNPKKPESSSPTVRTGGDTAFFLPRPCRFESGGGA